MLRPALETSACTCQHAGRIAMQASQDWVIVDTVPMLVKGDLDRRSISLCQGGAELVGVTRCRMVATVDDAKSHSQFVSIDARPVVLSSACGATDWSLIAVAPWTMNEPGQDWIEIVEG
jgi:hypothetical protein